MVRTGARLQWTFSPILNIAISSKPGGPSPGFFRLKYALNRSWDARRDSGLPMVW